MARIVARQYEEFPYPARDPAEERKRLITGSPSHLAEIDHHLFGGCLRARGPLRILVAGGGTGDAAIMLGEQTRAAGIDADILYLDLSTASRAIAQKRAAIRGLERIRFATGSLLDPPEAGPFDYIDCCGVLHHLPDPQAGFDTLAGLLKPDGGMGVMVYAPHGRSGVYPMQQAVAALAGGVEAEPRAKLAAAKALLKSLPPSSLFARNPLLSDHVAGGDAGLYDLLCHAIDRPFTVMELAALVQAAGLRMTRFIEPMRYDPTRYLKDPALLEAARALPALEQAALAEALSCAMRTHVVYLTRAEHVAPPPPSPEDMRAIPVLRDPGLRLQARELKPGASIRLVFDRVPFDIALPDLAGPILTAIDGERDLAGIVRALPGSVGPERAMAAFQALYAPLEQANKLLLRLPGDDRGA